MRDGREEELLRIVREAGREGRVVKKTRQGVVVTSDVRKAREGGGLCVGS